MNFKAFLKLYWIRILLIVVSFPLILILIYLIIFGIKTFLGIENFYRKMTISQIPFTIYLSIITGAFYALMWVFFHYWFFYAGGISRIMGNKKLKIKPETVNVKWHEVIGMENIKKEVWEVIKLINDRQRVKAIGGKIIKGVLLYGPPGCGKTYLAKAIATETKLPFLHTTGSELVGIFVGVGAATLRQIFKKARVLAEQYGGCIIFIDEIDAVARPRVGLSGLGAGIDYNATLNQLLTEMDGLASNDDNIIVIAATNIHPSEFDPALMRPGRFDRKIYVASPGLNDRKKLFEFYLSKINYDKENVDIDKLARITSGDSAADIANIVRESALIAARNKRNIVTLKDLYEAHERIYLGLKTDIVMSEEEKKWTAYHEAGHAIITYLIVPTEDVFKASIIPRAGFPGVVQFMSKEDKKRSLDKKELLGYIKAYLGGYCAEKLVFGRTTTGVSSDLARANRLAIKMVMKWGMGTRGPAGVSPNSLSDDSSIEDWLPPGIESEKDRIITTCMEEVTEILQKERKLLDALAEELIKREELNYDELEKIFHSYGGYRLSYIKKEVEIKGLTWNNLIGLNDTKEELKEMVNIFKERANSKTSGGKNIRGILLLGPPGCGKTYLATIMANEARLPIISKAGPEFIELYVGVGASRVRNLFQEAREKALAHGGCIIFIDEIDAIAGKRIYSGGGNREYNQTLNQLLVEMDGFKEKDMPYNILVIGATNVSESDLDPALLRPGRFDKKIYITIPHVKDREELFRYYINKENYPIDENIDYQQLAVMTTGRTPADIQNIVKEAALLAEKNKRKITMSDLHLAKERVVMGMKTNLILSDTDRKIMAYHEAGHTLATYFLAPSHNIVKTSIIPRKEGKGETLAITESDKLYPNKEELMAKIKILLGGYAAEKVNFGITSSYVGDDLKKAREIAYDMVAKWGMGTTGPSVVSELSSNRVIDDDIDRIINDCLDELNEVFQKEKRILDEIAERLLREEELEYSVIDEIIKKYNVDRNTYIYDKEKTKREKGITFDDVIGMSEIKEEAKEIVSLLKDRAKAKQIGGQIIRGLLLFGSPGTGKTYLARAIANECGLPFIAKSGSEFVELYVGVGASRVRSLFREAREKALAHGGCIIFIDEFDALAGRRRQDLGFGGTTEYNQTLNQLLVEMDGLKEKDEKYNILVIGATNMPEEFFDEAILRPGRFDRKIKIHLPTWEERKQLFEYYLSKVKYNKEEIHPDKFASITSGWSPADIANLVKEAALLAIRDKKDMIGIKQMDEARERISLGLKRALKQSERLKLMTAYHETGHILATAFLKGKKYFPFKVSIIRRTRTLGVAWYACTVDDTENDREELKAHIMGSLAGYAAEKIKFGTTTGGVTSDFEHALSIANFMVKGVGMGESGLLGNFLSVSRNGNISESINEQLDRDVQQILQKCLRETEEMLKREKVLLDKFAEELFKKEELNYNEIEEIITRYAVGKIEA